MKAPVNNKSLFAFLCDKLEKIDSGVYSRDQIEDVIGVTSKVQKALEHELARVQTECKRIETNHNYKSKIELREIEIKGFDDTTDQR